MGLFEKIFRPGKDRDAKKATEQANTYFQTLTGYRPVFSTWGGEIYESELVRAAIDARARHASKLRVELHGTARPSLQNKLRTGPNQWQTWSQFLYRLSTILDVNNAAFVVPVRDEDYNTTGYFPLLPLKCEIVEWRDEPWLRYKFDRGQVAAVPMTDVAIMTRFQYRSDFLGETNNALDETMKLIHIQNQGVTEAIKTSATYRFMARLTNFAKPSDLAKERAEFNAENFKAEAGGGMLLFPNTYSDIQQIKSTPYTVDAEQMRIIQTNVYNYFGVNEAVLQNAAYGDAWTAFYEGAVEPFAVQFSESMTRAIFTERERTLGNYVAATSNRLQYLSNTEKLNVSAQMADRGIMNRDEIREIWNLPPLPDGQGQAYTIRGEYYLLNPDGTATVRGETKEGNTDAE